MSSFVNRSISLSVTSGFACFWCTPSTCAHGDAAACGCGGTRRSGMRAAEGGVLHMRGEKTHIGRNRHSGLYASGAGSKIHIHLPQSLNIVHNNGGNGGSSQRGAAGGGAGAGAEKTDDAKSNVLQEDSGEVVYEAGS